MSPSSFPDETTAAALQAMPDAVVAVNGKGVIRFANSKAEELSGYSSDELIGKRIEILVPQSRRPTHRRDLKKYLNAPAPREMGARRDLGLRRKDGIIVPVAISLSPLSDSDEHIVVSTIQDVSEQERRSKEYLLLDELGALVAKEHKIENVYELLESSLPILFEFDRLVVTSRVPGTELMERVFVSGRSVSEEGVGTRVPVPEKINSVQGSLPHNILVGAPETGSLVGNHHAEAGLQSWLRVSLGDPENPTGYLNLRSANADAYDADDLTLFERVASLVSPAFENARLYAQVRKETHERTVLADISRIITSTPDIEKVYDLIAGRIRELVPFDRIVVSTIDRSRNLVTDRYVSGLRMKGGESGATYPLDDSLTGELLEGSRPRWFSAEEIASMDQKYPANLPRFEAGLKSLLAVPLIWNDEPLGMLNLRSRDENAYGETDAANTVNVAAQIVGAIANDMLRQEVEKRAVESSSLARIGRAIGWLSEDRAVWEDCARQIMELMPADFIQVHTVDKSQDSFSTEYEWYKSGERRPLPKETKLEGTVTGEVVATRQAVMVDNTLPLDELHNRFPATDFSGILNRETKSIAVPVVHGGDIVGVLHIGYPAEESDPTRHLQLAKNIADQLAGQITSVRLMSEIRRESKIRDVLASVSRIITSTQNLHDVFGQFAEAVREFLPADQIYIRLVNEDGTSYEESFGWSSREFDRPSVKYTPVIGSPMELLAAGQSTINISDHNVAEMSARYSVIREMRHAGLKSMAATALRYQDKFVGGLVIATTEAKAYDAREIKLLEEISAQVAGAIVNSEMAASLGREAKRRRILAEIGQAVSSSLDASAFFDRFAVLAKKLIPFDSFSYADYDPDGNTVTLRYWHGYDLPFIAQDAGITATGTIAADAAAVGHAILVPADSGRPVVDHTSRIPANADEALKEVICVPLTSRNAVFSCLYLGSEREGVFTTEHLNLADQLADQVSGAISNARSHEKALRAEKEKVESEARNRELERLNEQRSAFLSTVSHELKTPLTSLMAFADILVKNRDANLTERQLIQVQVMQRSARRLDVLINDLLDVSKLDIGEFKLIKRTFEVKDLIEELRIDFAPVIQAKNQTLDVHYPDGEALIDADQDRIAQLISNLLNNASKYSDRGAEITLSLSFEGSSLLITVEDTGIGMDEKTLKSLFTPFFRSDDELTQSEPGSGLGLVISKSIAELHGGTISVSSKRGVGTKVQVLLPRHDSSKPKY